MKFRYRDYLVELLVLGIEYPSFPAKKGERAVTIWQVLIDDDKPRIKKGSKKEIIDKIKRHIREIEGEEFHNEDDEDFYDEDEDVV
jgi:hypothetical protein